MCKIFALSNTSGLDAAELASCIRRSHREITVTARQRDGWGFALGEYVEKLDNPEQWPGQPGQLGALDLGGAVVELDAIASGVMPDPGPPLIVHGRIATCARGAENAHPHVAGQWTVVHNGVVEPRTSKARRTCDSMHIADSLAKHAGPHKLARDVVGYLAILGIDPAGRLFALRDRTAPLWLARVPEWDCYALASTPELLRSIVGRATGPVFQLAAFRWHVAAGDRWDVQEVAAWDAARPHLAGKAGKAFGLSGGKSKWAAADEAWEAEYQAAKNERWPLK